MALATEMQGIFARAGKYYGNAGAGKEKAACAAFV
jgi:hypothetical protein